MAFLLTKPLGRMLLAIVAVVIVAVVWFLLQVDPVFAGKGKEVIVNVAPGDSLATIAGELHHEGVIASPFAFRIDTLIFGAPLVQSGSYEHAPRFYVCDDQIDPRNRAQRADGVG